MALPASNVDDYSDEQFNPSFLVQAKPVPGPDASFQLINQHNHWSPRIVLPPVFPARAWRTPLQLQKFRSSPTTAILLAPLRHLPSLPRGKTFCSGGAINLGKRRDARPAFFKRNVYKRYDNTIFPATEKVTPTPLLPPPKLHVPK